MNATPEAVDPHNATSATHSVLHESFFALFGGPIAWFLQLCAGYVLASTPCWQGGEPVMHSPLASQSPWAGMAGSTIAVLIALGAMLLSLRVHRQARDAASRADIDPGVHRAAFLSLWGAVLGGGSALAASLTGVAFDVLPACVR